MSHYFCFPLLVCGASAVQEVAERMHIVGLKAKTQDPARKSTATEIAMTQHFSCPRSVINIYRTFGLGSSYVKTPHLTQWTLATQAEHGQKTTERKKDSHTFEQS